ncbi:hypothetical protein PB1_16499 [Bacillus methanolicus PB1]|uniref:Uncharacterized protein n=1 Tax=Bacillus methanolicus PB1 TaxID=997296 RepID=I3DY54_BACMT|nr:hypothetical protein [Bacillus methanolicus]EIJ79175.1 hypothetical protein PB1_16499 [Bacillus methanolicus PB1]
MAQCKFCGKKGIFLTVSKAGLCNKCHNPVMFSIERHVEIINESLTLVETSKNFNTKMNRLDLVEEQYRILDKDYYSKGISVLSDTPRNKLKEVQAIRKRLVEEEIENRIEKHMDKAKLAKSVNAKINNANKALMELKEFAKEYGYLNELLVHNIQHFIHKVELDDLILKAEKFEFKGNNKKALEQYQEALFFLKKDDIPDQKQDDLIRKLENKINSLKEDSNKQRINMK